MTRVRDAVEPRGPIPHRQLPQRQPRTPGRPFKRPEWEWIKPQGSAVGWWLRPGWRDALLGPEGLRLEQWRSEGRLELVKSSPQRIVYRALLPGGAVYIKHFLVPGLREVFRQWFRRGKGRNEGKRAARLAAQGIMTIEPVALGEERRRGFLFENFLITREIENMIPLDRFLERVLPEFPPKRGTRLRQRIARGVGELTARLHEAGFTHIDYHPGNLLVRLDAGDKPRIAMIDLDALRQAKRVGPKAAIHNLVLLNHYFWTRSSRSDRHRFLTAYVAGRPGAGYDARQLARRIERETRGWAERLWRRWARRCTGSNKYFQRLRSGRTWAIAARDLDPGLVLELMAHPDQPFERPGSVLLKDSRTTKVAACDLPGWSGPLPVIYKRFNCKKRLDPLLGVFRPSRGWRAWLAAQHLTVRGIPTPRNLIFIGCESQRKLRFLPSHFQARTTYLVTHRVEPALTLGEFAQEHLARIDPEARRRAIRSYLPALAQLMRKLHDRSLSHRDLKSANILIDGDPWSLPPRLTVIDLVGVTLEHPLPRRRQVQNLARLHLSLSHVPGKTRTDALRFLRRYLPCARFAAGEWKTLWREIEAASRQKVRQNEMRGRPIS
jgi:tRNA A-37 threonylcarbamoyl transferase component Bud32